MKRERFGCDNGQGQQLSMQDNQKVLAQARVWTRNHFLSRNPRVTKRDRLLAFESHHSLVRVGLLLFLSFGLKALSAGAAQRQPLPDHDLVHGDGTSSEWIDFRNEGTYIGIFSQRAAEVSTIITTMSSARSVSLEVFLPGMWILDFLMADNNIYSSLIVPGGGTFEIGKPDIPIFGRWVLVPNGTDLSLSVIPGEPIVFDNIDVPPVQLPELDFPGAASPKFTKDEAVYSLNAEYPGLFVETEPVKNIRGQDCTIVWLYPYQYNPVTRQLNVYKDLVVDIEFDGKIQQSPKHLKSGDFEKMFKRLAVNAEIVLSVQRQLGEQPNPFEGSRIDGSQMPLNGMENGFEGLESLMIICDPAFESAAKTLAAWKRLCGLPTYVVTTDVTGVTVDQIEDYIDNCQSWSLPPSYLLLLGDAEFIPCFYRLTHYADIWTSINGGLMQGKVASDRYYSDTNDDGVADLYIGRLPVDTLAKAQIAVNRIIDYERTPPLNSEFYETFATVAYFQDDDKNGYEDRRFVKTSEDIYQFLTELGYHGQRIYHADDAVNPTNWSTDIIFENDRGGGQPLSSVLRKPNFLWNGDTKDILDVINNGSFLMTYRGHGFRIMRLLGSTSGSYGGWAHPSFTEDNAGALHNGSLVPMVWSPTCMAGWFDNETDDARYDWYHPDGSIKYMLYTHRYDECLCEELILNPAGGAIGVIGSTRTSPSICNDRLAWGWMDAIWPNFISSFGDVDSLCRMGPIFEYGKNYLLQKYPYQTGDYVKTVIDEYVLFGDPSMEIRTTVPDDLKVTHPASIITDQVINLTVTVEIDGIVLPHARVTVSNPSIPEDYWTGLTDASGRVTFFGLKTHQSGDYYIVVTAKNCRPFEGLIISVGSRTSPDNQDERPSGVNDPNNRDCFPFSDPAYETWEKVGKPASWCNPFQRFGDANGQTEGEQKYRVWFNDLDILTKHWGKTSGDPAYNPCADFDHDGRIGPNDLEILIANWKKTDAELLGGRSRRK